MRNLISHLNPFILTTGIAAFIHSTWSLATIFAGSQPNGIIEIVFWLIPAMAIAFALDVGQIATSVEIANHHGRKIEVWPKYITFILFAFATYYLQWWHLVHHFPIEALTNGVPTEWVAGITYWSNMAIFIAPLLLPASTLMYTFGYGKPKDKSGIMEIPKSEPIVITKKGDDIKEIPAKIIDNPASEATLFFANCDLCSWSESFDTDRKAKHNLTRHKKTVHSGV